MKINFMPKTTLGKWSLGLIVVMPILFIVGISFTSSLYKSVSSGNTILEDIVKRPALALTMLAAFVSGILAFIMGGIAVIRQKEKSIFVFISTLIGFFVLLWCFAEILFPH